MKIFNKEINWKFANFIEINKSSFDKFTSIIEVIIDNIGSIWIEEFLIRPWNKIIVNNGKNNLVDFEDFSISWDDIINFYIFAHLFKYDELTDTILKEVKDKVESSLSVSNWNWLIVTNIWWHDFRISAYLSKWVLNLSIRILTKKPLDLKDINFPKVALQKFIEDIDKDSFWNLFLISGPPWNWKSTTLISLITAVSNKFDFRIETLEDPSEYTYPEDVLIIQREYWIDFMDYTKAVENILTKKVDLIIVPEIRTKEMYSAVLKLLDSWFNVIWTIQSKSIEWCVSKFKTNWLDFIWADKLMLSNLKWFLEQRLYSEWNKKEIDYQLLVIPEQLRLSYDKLWDSTEFNWFYDFNNWSFRFKKTD